MNKRGFLFTFGLFLLGLIIFALAVLISNNVKLSNEGMDNIIRFDRVYEVDLSIQEGFNEIFKQKSGISVSYSGKNITIEENIPNSNKDDFISKTNSFKNFVEDKFDFIILDLSNIQGKMNLNLEPANIGYSHDTYGGDKIIIENASNANAYELYFWNATINASVDWTKTSPGSLPIRVIFESPGWRKEDEKSINPNNENRVRIKEGNTEYIDTKIENNQIVIENKDVIGMLNKVTISNVERNEVFVPNVVIINFVDLKKTGKIIIK